MSLTKEAFSAAKWSGILSILQQGISSVSAIILYRLLSPEDYGLAALVVAYVTVVNMVENLGFVAPLIQRKEVSDSLLNTAFWAVAANGIILFCIMALVSPLIGWFYNDKRLVSITIMSSLTIVFGVLMVIQRVLLYRELDMKLYKQIDIAATVIANGVSIGMAASGFGVWALVCGTLSHLGSNMLIMWHKVKWRPRMEFNFKEFRELLGFGWHVMSAKVFAQVKTILPQAIMGKALGVISLGYYSFANKVVLLANNQLRGAIAQVLLPSFAKVQDDNERLRRGYLKTIYYITVVLLPVMTGIFIISPELVNVVFGKQWTPAVAIVKIVCLLGLIEEFFLTGQNIFYAKNRPDFISRWNLIMLVSNIPVLLVFARYGLKEVVLALVVVSFILFVFYQDRINRLIDLTWPGFLRNLYVPFAATLFSALSVFIVRSFMFSLNVNEILILVTEVLTGILIYCAGIYCLDRAEFHYFWKMVRGTN